MKELFANAEFGMAGLIIFFVFFCGAIIWTMRPNAKSEYKKYGEIPLKDENNDR